MSPNNPSSRTVCSLDQYGSPLPITSLLALARLLARQAAREHLSNHSEPSEERHEAIDQY